jgi:hypothetical protein
LLRRPNGAEDFDDVQYLYQDGPRYWYATQPTVTKLAEDRAQLLQHDPDKVVQELEQRLRADLRSTGDFPRIHALPRSSGDVPDDFDTRLVVLPMEHPYSKEPGNAAETAAKAILESRGTSPRLCRNTLVFLAVDKVRFQDLDEALRKYLAWKSIVDDKDTLNLDPYQVRQAETQRQASDGVVAARVPEAYQWLLVPEQATPKAESVTWQAIRLTGADALAVRASRKLKTDELLVASLGATILRKHLDDVPLWRDEHVPIRQLVDDFARYLYLPRLAGPEVLMQAVGAGLALLTWQTDTFAYAESYDEAARRYRGLRGGQVVAVTPEDAGLLVRPDIARRQLAAEVPPTRPTGTGTGVGDGGTDQRITAEPGTEGTTTAVPTPLPRRFHGTVRLDPMRVGRDASRIADEVIAHLVGQVGTEVVVTLEIDASLPNGASEQTVRTVTENSRELKFTSQGFESE